MVTVNIHEAKTHLSKLLSRASIGEEVIISKSGKPLARLVPFSQAAAKRIPGQDSGLFTVPHDFDSPLPDDLERSFQE